MEHFFQNKPVCFKTDQSASPGQASVAYGIVTVRSKKIRKRVQKLLSIYGVALTSKKEQSICKGNTKSICRLKLLLSFLLEKVSCKMKEYILKVTVLTKLFAVDMNISTQGATVDIRDQNNNTAFFFVCLGFVFFFFLTSQRYGNVLSQQFFN